MPDIGCASWDTAEDKAIADEHEEWAKTEQTALGNTPQVVEEMKREIERVRHEIERAIEKDMVRCIEENIEKSQEAIRESLKDITPNELEKQDLKLWPTQEEREVMVKTGKESGMSIADIIFTPPIVGTPGVEKMEEKIKSVMTALHTSNIPPEFRDVSVFSKIMFVNQRGEEGITGPKIADFNVKTGVLHIYRNEEGKFPSVEEIKQVILPHEVFHANRDDFMQRISEHKNEWMMVNAKEAELPSKYVSGLVDAWREGKITTEILNEELAAEWYRRYVTGQCSERTAVFFKRYFSE